MGWKFHHLDFSTFSPIFCQFISVGTTSTPFQVRFAKILTLLLLGLEGASHAQAYRINHTHDNLA